MPAVKRTVRIFRGFKEAEEAEIRDQAALTPAQRLEIFRQLKKRVFGRTPIDVRAFHGKKK
jgi:hypothetical protein